MAATTGTPRVRGKPPAAVTAARLSVDRLTLHVPAMSEAEARLLVEQVGEALRDWPTARPPRAGSAGSTCRSPRPASTGAAMAGSAAGTGQAAADGTGDIAQIAAAILNHAGGALTMGTYLRRARRVDADDAHPGPEHHHVPVQIPRR